MTSETIISVENLKKHFDVGSSMFGESKRLKAVDDVSFDIAEGEVLGLAGESGCGKSTTALTLSGLEPPTDGTVYFRGTDCETIPEAELRRNIQYIFQDPFASTNPKHKANKTITEAPRNLTDLDDDEAREVAFDMLEQVGLDPHEFADKYPHEMSGGELQRVSIAAALSVNPELLIADEPTTMLDASNRGRITRILKDLISDQNISILYISHDLGILNEMADRIAIMYLGKIVEIGTTEEIIENPKHPYTRALVSASLVPDPTEPLPDIDVEHEIPQPINLPQGCNFKDRCPNRGDKCDEEPMLEQVDGDHSVSCFYPVEYDE